MTDPAALDTQLAAAPDAPSRAALLGIDFAALVQTSGRLRISMVVITIASALTVVGLGVLIRGVELDGSVLPLAFGLIVALVPFILSSVLASAVVRGVRSRTTPQASTVLAGALWAGFAAVLAVAASRLLLPFGEVAVLGLAAGMTVGSAMPALAIAALPRAFRRPNPNLAEVIGAFRALPPHTTTLDGRFAHLVAGHTASQFAFVALVPISVANAGGGVAAALVLAGIGALTTQLDLRARPVASLLVAIAAAAVFLAAAIVAAV